VTDKVQTAIALLAVKLAAVHFTTEWTDLPERTRSAYRTEAIKLLSSSENDGWSASAMVTLPHATQTLIGEIEADLENLMRARVFGMHPSYDVSVTKGLYTVDVRLRNDVTLKERDCPQALFDLISGSVEQSRHKYYENLLPAKVIAHG
jgi:hypothetical protein